jgi:hypothetical protein
VALPHYDMGRWAVERLPDLIDGTAPEPAQTALRGYAHRAGFGRSPGLSLTTARERRLGAARR